ncbi:hypothetical protein C0J52_00722 [Blattella germanica]|nr:hypothetical protein C0J52_00722 [Blattella germanica]
MREDRLPKKIFEWQPMGRKKRGRPNITWTEGILNTTRERGIKAYGYTFLIGYRKISKIL